MIAAVIPVKDEERPKKNNRDTFVNSLDIIIPVVNGSSDGSYSIINRVPFEANPTPLFYRVPGHRYTPGCRG